MSSFCSEHRAVARSDNSLTLFDVVAGNLTLQQILFVATEPNVILEKICLATSNQLIVRCGDELISFKLMKTQDNTNEFVRSDKVLNLKKLCPTKIGGPDWIRVSPMNNYLYMYFDNLSHTNFFVYDAATEEIIIPAKSDRKMRPSDVSWSDDDKIVAVQDNESIAFWEMPSGRTLHVAEAMPNDKLSFAPSILSSRSIRCVVTRKTSNGRELIRFELPINNKNCENMCTERRLIYKDLSEETNIPCPSNPLYYFEVSDDGKGSYDLRFRCAKCLADLAYIPGQFGLWCSPTRTECVLLSPDSGCRKIDIVQATERSAEGGGGEGCECRRWDFAHKTLQMNLSKNIVVDALWSDDGNSLVISLLGGQTGAGNRFIYQRLFGGQFGQVAVFDHQSMMSFAGDYVCELELGLDSAMRNLTLYKRDGQPVFEMSHDLYKEILWI